MRNARVEGNLFQVRTVYVGAADLGQQTYRVLASRQLFGNACVRFTAVLRQHLLFVERYARQRLLVEFPRRIVVRSAVDRRLEGASKVAPRPTVVPIAERRVAFAAEEEVYIIVLPVNAVT